MDFDVLEKTHSSEEAIREKNKIMIPLYKEVISMIKNLKKNPFNELKFQYDIAKDEIIRKSQERLEELTSEEK